MAETPMGNITEVAEKTLAAIAEQKEKLKLMKGSLTIMEKLGEDTKAARAALEAMENLIAATERIVGPVAKAKS